MSRLVELWGHRGARWLWPENTMEGFRRTIALGVTGIEFDVAMAADGTLIVSHDPQPNPNLTRGPDGKWIADSGVPFMRRSLAEITSLDVGRLKPGTAYAAMHPEQQPIDGAHIPTLAEIFALPPPTRFMVETKTLPDKPGLTPGGVEMVRAVVALADRMGVTGRLLVQSFDWSGMVWLRRTRPEIAHSFLTEARTERAAAVWWAGHDARAHHGSVPRAVQAAGGLRWGPNQAELSQEDIGAAHAIDLSVVPWTVNDPAAMRRLISWGVDGLITDRPDVGRAAIAATAGDIPPT